MTTKPDWIKFKIPILCKGSSYSLYRDKERELWLFNCSKNRYLENRILSVILIFRTSLCTNFSTYYLAWSLLFFRWYLCVNSRKGFSFCTCFISIIRDSHTILRDRELWWYRLHFVRLTLNQMTKLKTGPIWKQLKKTKFMSVKNLNLYWEG